MNLLKESKWPLLLLLHDIKEKDTERFDLEVVSMLLSESSPSLY